MNIDGTIIEADVADVINELRNQLALQGIELFTKTKNGDTDLMVQCPYHKNGQEKRPSAGIRKSDGMFHCLACGETRSLPELVSDCFGKKDFTFGYKWLIKNFSSTEVKERGDIILDYSRTNNVNVHNVGTSTITEKELDEYRYFHPYMYERGLTDDVIEEFDIGYDVKTDSITFPVKDINGRCLFVAKRKVSYKRFDLPKNLEKPLYGLYEVNNISVAASDDLIDEVWVCEGLFDCLRLWCNYRYAVAGFGCLFSDYQIKQLESLPTRKLVLALDNDIAGRKATERLKQKVKGKIISTVKLPKGRKDIGECTDEEIQKLVETLY